MNRDPKEHWKQQASERRAKLERIRSELRLARQRYLQSASDVDASNVTSLADRERLADEALTYAEEQANAVTNTDPQELQRQRAVITHRMAGRHREREEQIRLERQRCGRMPEHHVEVHLRNVFGRYNYRECVGDDVDTATLRRIDSQLADHERRAEQSNQPPSAA